MKTIEEIIQEVLDIKESVYEMDINDIKLSYHVFQQIGESAKKIMLMYGPRYGKPSYEILNKIITMMKERVYWIENTQELVFVIEIDEDLHFVTIPRQHWDYISKDKKLIN